LMVDPVTALRLHYEGRQVPLSPGVNINLGELLGRGYAYNGLRFTKLYDLPEIWVVVLFMRLQELGIPRRM
jgi:hypothetical protein